MNRGTRTLVVLGVAVLAAAAASYGVYAAIRSIPERRVEIATRFAVWRRWNCLSDTPRAGAGETRAVAREDAHCKGGFTDVAQVVDRGLIANVSRTSR
jgi:hypothetical protein